MEFGQDNAIHADCYLLKDRKRHNIHRRNKVKTKRKRIASFILEVYEYIE